MYWDAEKSTYLPAPNQGEGAPTVPSGDNQLDKGDKEDKKEKEKTKVAKKIAKVAKPEIFTVIELRSGKRHILVAQFEKSLLDFSLYLLVFIITMNDNFIWVGLFRFMPEIRIRKSSSSYFSPFPDQHQPLPTRLSGFTFKTSPTNEYVWTGGRQRLVWSGR